MYIECDAAHRTVRPSVAAVLWKRPPRWPVAGPAGHRPQAMLRAAMCRCSVQISEDFQATWLRFFGCEMLWIFCVNHQSVKVADPKSGLLKILQKQKQGKIDQLLSHAKSCLKLARTKCSATDVHFSPLWLEPPSRVERKIQPQHCMTGKRHAVMTWSHSDFTPVISRLFPCVYDVYNPIYSHL